MENQADAKNIEFFDGELAHPSLDIKDGVLILGFRRIAKDRKLKEFYLIAKSGDIRLIEDDYFEVGGKKYFIEKGHRKIAKMEQKWGVANFTDFYEKYRDIKPWPKPTPKGVFETIMTLLKIYIELECEADYSLLTAWIIGTYFFPVFPAYPYLHIKAPKRSGKSQCLEFLKQTCFNAIKSRPSVPAFADTMDALRGTYLIDQADSLSRKGYEDFLDYLADSYKKGGGNRRIIMYDSKFNREPKEYETYGPKVFASTEDIPEDLADRCIIIPLIRSRKNFPSPDEESQDWKKIRGDLYITLIDSYIEFSAHYLFERSAYKNSQEITGRELELWLPIMTILDVCGQINIDEAKKRFRQLYGYTEYQASEIEKAIIEVIYQLFTAEDSKITLRPQEIREKIVADIWPDKIISYHQKNIAIGYAIKKFNISSDKKSTSKGINYTFEKEKVEKIRNLYCPIENTPDSPSDSQINTNPSQKQ